MKKTNLIITLVVATAVMLITSCKGGKDATEKDTVAKAGSVAVDTLNNVAKGKAFGPEAIQNEPVCANLALQCIEKYKQMYDSTNFNEAFVKNAYSRSATFDKAKLVKWINHIDSNTETDSIKVFFGVYTEEMAQIDPNVKANRLTVFLWPYFKGDIATYKSGATQVAAKGCKVATKLNEQGGVPVAPYNIAGLEP